MYINATRTEAALVWLYKANNGVIPTGDEYHEFVQSFIYTQHIAM